MGFEWDLHGLFYGGWEIFENFLGKKFFDFKVEF